MNYRIMKNVTLMTVISILLISCSKDEQINDETNKNEQYNIKIEENINVSVKDAMMAEDSASIWILMQKTDVQKVDTTIVIGNKKITIK